MKKLLVVGVTVLFIGLAFAPSINANVSKASVDSELVEFTTEVCGLNGGKQTVSLSKEDALEVEQLIDDIERRLDEVETREETVEIFNEAVVELDKYGLLGGLSVKQAQKLVTGGYQSPIIKRALERMYNRNSMLLDGDENLFCLIAGKTSITIFEGRITRFIWWAILWDIPYFLLSVLSIFYLLGILLEVKIPIAMAHRIGLGVTQLLWNISSNATGWIYTNGLNGIKEWNGSLRGNLSRSYRQIWNCPGLTFGFFEVYQGVSGFRGMKIYLDGFFYYMGFATRVKISPTPLEV